MKTNNKKFTHVIRSFEDAVGFDEEADIERYEKFANAKKQKKVEMEEQTLAKKPSKLRDNKKFEEDLQATLSEARIAKFKEGKEKEIAALDEALVAETKKVLDNADYTEEQKGLMVATLREKYGAEVAEIDAKFEKEANDKEKSRLDSIIKKENFQFSKNGSISIF